MLAGRAARAHTEQRPFLAALAHPRPVGCRLGPIVGGGAGGDDWCMVQLAIRCHPCAPVSAGELEGWLERQVAELRAAAPHGTVRLSRLTQAGPSAHLAIGWLVELDLDEDEPLLAGQRIGNALRDMRLLGLQPTLLAPHGAWTNGRAA
jgi:hypothetical protein